MVLLLPNAWVSTTRVVDGTVSPILSGAPWRIWSETLPQSALPGNEVLLSTFRFSADRGEDVQAGDTVTGWNPLDAPVAPSFTVRVVHSVAGPLPHRTGLLVATGRSGLNA